MSDYISRKDAYTLAKRVVDAIASGDVPVAILGTEILDWIDDLPAADVVPWETLIRYANYFCAEVSMPEFVREAKMFYDSTKAAMDGGNIE